MVSDKYRKTGDKHTHGLMVSPPERSVWTRKGSSGVELLASLRKWRSGQDVVRWEVTHRLDLDCRESSGRIFEGAIIDSIGLCHWQLILEDEVRRRLIFEEDL